MIWVMIDEFLMSSEPHWYFWKIIWGPRKNRVVYEIVLYQTAIYWGSSVLVTYKLWMKVCLHWQWFRNQGTVRELKGLKQLCFHLIIKYILALNWSIGFGNIGQWNHENLRSRMLYLFQVLEQFEVSSICMGICIIIIHSPHLEFRNAEIKVHVIVTKGPWVLTLCWYDGPSKGLIMHLWCKQKAATSNHY